MTDADVTKILKVMAEFAPAFAKAGELLADYEKKNKELSGLISEIERRQRQLDEMKQEEVNQLARNQKIAAHGASLQPDSKRVREIEQREKALAEGEQNLRAEQEKVSQDKEIINNVRNSFNPLRQLNT